MRHPFASASASLVVLSCFLLPKPAHADSYSFSFTTPAGAAYALSASGTFTTDSSGGTQNITSLTGTLENGALTGDSSTVGISLIPVQAGTTAANPSVQSYSAGNGSTFYLYFDNILTPGASTELDFNGLGIESTDGVGYEIGSDGNTYAYEAFNDSIAFDQATFGQNNVPLDVTITDLGAAAVTPEPTSIALLGTGLLGIAGTLRRRMV